MNRFLQHLAAEELELRREELQVLQLNVGRRCNQACRHCHVDAAPWRTEMMNPQVVKEVIAWIERHRPPVVDITGGAPELHPQFRSLVQSALRAGCHVIDRNNLTILHEPDQADLAEFLASHQVEIIASLPCYSAANVDQQRGNGVFRKSIAALQRLNALGYGRELPLNLVYNPLGAKLPGPQAELEHDYKEALERDFGIIFHQLFTITNQPVARFAEDLRRQGRMEEYMDLLINSFNPSTVSGLMCRTTLSVDYEGRLFDCDFNQMLGLLPLRGEHYLWEVDPQDFKEAPIRTGDHCFACTAGAGSSCTGALQETGPSIHA